MPAGSWLLTDAGVGPPELVRRGWLLQELTTFTCCAGTILVPAVHRSGTRAVLKLQGVELISTLPDMIGYGDDARPLPSVKERKVCAWGSGCPASGLSGRGCDVKNLSKVGRGVSLLVTSIAGSNTLCSANTLCYAPAP
jgi:hypothetical protein